MRALGVIPARMAAQRFPGKPLALLAGRPLIRWVYDAASSCDALDEVIVATPDDAVIACVRDFGGVVLRTRADYATGTDRVAEVAATRNDVDVVVNVQGDQPFVTSEMLDALLEPFRSDEPPEMSTIAAPLAGPEMAADPNTVKVVCGVDGRALYFSRSDIPYARDPGPALAMHHIGLYAFSRDFLATYAAMSPTPLEQREGLEQLRVLEHGHRIHVARAERWIVEVNTPEDLVAAERVVATA